MLRVLQDASVPLSRVERRVVRQTFGVPISEWRRIAKMRERAKKERREQRIAKKSGDVNPCNSRDCEENEKK